MMSINDDVCLRNSIILPRCLHIKLIESNASPQTKVWIEQRQRELVDEIQRFETEVKIRKTLRPIYMPPSWYVFMAQHDNPALCRFKIYVATGSSGAGKTLSIRFQFPVGALLELNCAGGQLNPDFRQLRRPGHVAILCDEASPQMVAKHKVEFQAGNSPCTLGTSACNDRTYKVWFYKIFMIVCSNKWEQEKSLMSKEDRDWLDENTIVQPVDKDTFRLPYPRVAWDDI